MGTWNCGAWVLGTTAAHTRVSKHTAQIDSNFSYLAHAIADQIIQRRIIHVRSPGNFFSFAVSSDTPFAQAPFAWILSKQDFTYLFMGFTSSDEMLDIFLSNGIHVQRTVKNEVGELKSCFPPRQPPCPSENLPSNGIVPGVGGGHH